MKVGGYPFATLQKGGSKHFVIAQKVDGNLLNNNRAGTTLLEGLKENSTPWSALAGPQLQEDVFFHSQIVIVFPTYSSFLNIEFDSIYGNFTVYVYSARCKISSQNLPTFH